MRLRGLAPPLRYAAYVAGAFVVFFSALGLGAAASLVVGWQSERDQAGYEVSAGSGWFEDTAAETTAANAFEGTAIETTDEAENTGLEGPTEEASFVHTATEENSRGDYTYFGDPAIDGNPDAAVLVEPSPGREDAEGAYDHNVGVWYEPEAERWAIFNQDLAAVPAGAAFEVVVPPASESLVHRAAPPNIVGNVTYLDDPLTDGRPDAVLSVTQNWNPGGGVGVYNDHPVGVLYDRDVDRWALYNRDGAPMPEGAAFNVAVSASDENAR